MGSAPDRERVARRAAYIRERLERLRQLRATSDLASFTAPGAWTADGVRYALQTTIEALIDLAFHICAKRLNQAPGDARDAFGRLAQAGLLDQDRLRKASAMVGFRNLVVHGYQVVDDARVLQIVREELDDVDDLLQALENAAQVD